MARQAGDIFLRGTIDDLTYHKSSGVYYVRRKSSLTAKKFWKSKAFERSRESCWRFADGNKIASGVYRRIERKKKKYVLFCFLRKRAIQLLKQGTVPLEVEDMLFDYLAEFGLAKRKTMESVKGSAIADSVQQTVLFKTNIPLRVKTNRSKLGTEKIGEFLLSLPLIVGNDRWLKAFLKRAKECSGLNSLVLTTNTS